MINKENMENKMQELIDDVNGPCVEASCYIGHHPSGVYIKLTAVSEEEFEDNDDTFDQENNCLV